MSLDLESEVASSCESALTVIGGDKVLGRSLAQNSTRVDIGYANNYQTCGTSPFDS